MPPVRDPRVVVLTASALGLFLELALVRWVSSEIRVFAYCKNLVLVACFLGFGAGCLLQRRRALWLEGSSALLLLALLIRLPWQALSQYGPRRVTAVLAELAGFMIFHHEESRVPWGDVGRLAFAVGWTSFLFFLVAFLMIPFGQATARGMAALPRPLVGYTINVAGSLLGIGAFTAVTIFALPPLFWFTPVPLAAAALFTTLSRRRVTLVVGLCVGLALLPDDRPRSRDLWSAYQKLTITPERILVNNTGYQAMLPASLTRGEPNRPSRWSLPYRLKPSAARVLIVGAGTGNDAAEALAAGATTITAVEIDPTILDIGRRHPQRPYADPAVRAVVDDARHFLRTTGETFDLIVFSHLDAHAVLSAHTSVRLDNYIYTVEAFREARSRLAQGGLLYLAYFSELPFVGERLARNLEVAFGRPPIVFEGRTSERFREIYLLAGDGADAASALAQRAAWRGLRPVQPGPTQVIPSTDAWPFLHLEGRRVPPIVLWISLAILLVSFALAGAARPSGEPFDGRLFWLGAAFMLLEVHSVSRLALLFGTTWQVNAWVIGMILGLILLANAFCLWRGTGSALTLLGATGLFLSLAAARLVPLDSLQAWAPTLGGPAAIVLLCSPVLFAALLFAEAFADSPAPGFALGWNVLGAVVGGLAESLSYVWGIPALVILASAFYAAALLWPRRGSAKVTERASSAAPLEGHAA